MDEQVSTPYSYCNANKCDPEPRRKWHRAKADDVGPRTQACDSPANPKQYAADNEVRVHSATFSNGFFDPRLLSNSVNNESETQSGDEEDPERRIRMHGRERTNDRRWPGHAAHAEANPEANADPESNIRLFAKKVPSLWLLAHLLQIFGIPSLLNLLLRCHLEIPVRGDRRALRQHYRGSDGNGQCARDRRCKLKRLWWGEPEWDWRPECQTP
mmetsp:Transcript_8593/g.23929  ORF Transcript_8593/g.23929 Transcript_8593/m.23929 type:complete len:214 (-) Transcript_8593:447-1088(-)